MKPEELKAIDERAEKAGRIVLALGGSDDLELTLIESVGDIPALLAEVKRLQKIEAAIGAPTRRLIEENDRLRAECDGMRDMIDKLGENHAAEYMELLNENASLRAERDAAVMDMSVACIAGEACAVCANCRDRGDQFPCAISDKWCCGSAWEWRGMKGE